MLVGMKVLIGAAALTLAVLQYSIWFGQSGHFAQLRMQADLTQHQERAAVLKQRNRILTAEVLALKEDRGVLEARARRDLGMVKRGEVFYLIPTVD